MRVHHLVGAIILLGATTAIAGCLGPRTVVAPDELPTEATQEGVAQPYTLRVVVFEERPGGAPLPDVKIVPGHSPAPRFSVPQAEPSLPAVRTGADGVAILHLAPNHTAYLSIGGLPTHTDEALVVPLGAAGHEGTLNVALFKTHLTLHIEGVLPAGWGAQYSPPSVPPTDPHAEERFPLTFHADSAVAAAYAKRLRTLDLTLTWNNTPGASADLYAGFSWADGPPVEGQDYVQGPLDVGNAETVAWAADDLRKNPGAGPLSAVAITVKQALVVQSLPLAFDATATFAGREVDVI